MCFLVRGFGCALFYFREDLIMFGLLFTGILGLVVGFFLFKISNIIGALVIILGGFCVYGGFSMFGEELKNKKSEKIKEIKEAEPTEENKELMERHFELIQCKGNEKRAKMLEFEVRDKYKKIRELHNNQDFLNQYYDQLHKESYTMKEDTHWAILGGIAEGIAGPAAGVAVAADAMAKEQQIKEDKLKLMELSLEKKAASNVLTSSLLERTEKEIAEIESKVESAKKKMVRSIPKGDKIAENILIKKTQIQTCTAETGVKMTVEISLKNPVNFTLPKGTTWVIDGIISGKLYCKGNFIDDVKLTLPTYGIGTDSEESVVATGYCKKYAPYGSSDDYKLEITDLTNLWVMEY